MRAIDSVADGALDAGSGSQVDDAVGVSTLLAALLLHLTGSQPETDEVQTPCSRLRHSGRSIPRPCRSSSWADRPVPALLTRMSSRPNFSTVLAIRFSRAAALVTSVATPKCLAASSASISAATASHGLLLTAGDDDSSTVSGPWSCAMALPMPRVEPVMMATLSVQIIAGNRKSHIDPLLLKIMFL